VKTRPDNSESVPMLDLRGEICAISLARARVFLDLQPPGGRAVLLHSDGEPRRNLPEALAEAGYELLDHGPAETVAAAWLLTVRCPGE